jgi:hypothetical protein
MLLLLYLAFYSNKHFVELSFLQKYTIVLNLALYNDVHTCVCLKLSFLQKCT